MKQQFAIVLEGGDDHQPTVIRLRQLLKLADRAYRLRCVGCQEIEDVNQQSTTDGAVIETPSNQPH